MPRFTHVSVSRAFTLRTLRAALVGAIAVSLACSDHDRTPLNPSQATASGDFETASSEQNDDRPVVAASGLVPNTPQLLRLAADTTRCVAISDDLTRIGNPVLIARCGLTNPRHLFTYNTASEIRTSAGSCVGVHQTPSGPVVAVVPCDGRPASKWIYDAAQRLASGLGSCFNVVGITLTPGASVTVAGCASPAPWSQHIYWNTPGTPVVAPAPAPAPTPTPTPPPPTGPVITSIVISPPRMDVVQGDSIRLTPTAYDANGQPVATTFTWSVTSGNNLVSVTQQGIVRGLVLGTAIVAAQAGGVTGTSAVTVIAGSGTTQPPPSGPAPPPPSVSVPSTPATLPLATVDVSWRAPTGRTFVVRAGDNLQNALNAAARGDEIVIDAGATFTGNFVLPAKPGTAANGWITVRTSHLGSLPPQGTRINSAQHAAFMPKIVAPNAVEALRTQNGASGWRLVGLEVTVTPSLTWVHNGLVLLGDGSPNQNQLSQVASDLILDRVYIHGQSTVNLKRCVALNSARTAIVDSHLLECHGRGFDAQAIGGWNGPGPYLIENNRLEGSGEVIIFGGSDPAIPNLITSDVTVRRNYMVRPMSWKGVWTVKNLFELKNAQRVLVEGNVMENNWVDGQIGFAIMLGSVNQDGRCTWCVVQDVTLRYNHIHNSAGGFNVFERYANAQPVRRVSLHHNLLTNIGASGLGSNGMMYVLIDGVHDVWIEHNTGFAPQTYISFSNFSTYKNNFTYRNNIGGGALYNLHSAEAMGAAALTRHLSTPYVFAGNVFVGTSVGMPAANSYAPSTGSVGFLNPVPFGGSWGLTPLSPYYNAGTGGTTPGVNWTTLANMTANVRQ